MTEFDLRKEEYLTLRKEIETQMTDLASLEKNCVLATAIVYAWLVKDGAGSTIAKAGWFIPVLFPLFGGLRSLAIGRHLSVLGSYIYKIESALLPEADYPNGWQHYLDTHSKRHMVRTWITATFWIVFLVVTIWVAMKYGH